MCGCYLVLQNEQECLRIKIIFNLSFPGNGKGFKMRQNEKNDDKKDNDSQTSGEVVFFIT